MSAAPEAAVEPLLETPLAQQRPGPSAPIAFRGALASGDLGAAILTNVPVDGQRTVQVTATDDISVKYSGTIRATAPTGVGIRAISTAGGDISIDGSGPSGGACRWKQSITWG